MRAEHPSGFLYRPDVLAMAEERDLLARLDTLDLEAIVMRGQVARRRTAHFGWVYGYTTARVAPGRPIPEFLLPLRRQAAALAGIAPEALVEVLVTDYPPGAGIGWHRDARQFGPVVGVPLLTACRLRLRRGSGAERQARSVILAPRSAYLLDGEARWQWQHSIPPLTARRWSITFRTLRAA